MPGLPWTSTLELVTGMVSSLTQAFGSKYMLEPLKKSMPICAPVGGSAGEATNGHNTGAWSEVIRQADTGTPDGDQPWPFLRGPRAGLRSNRRGSRCLRVSTAVRGNSWWKSVRN